MPLIAELCHAAVATRDARADGRFYFAPVSPGVYCRTICTARPPDVSDRRYFASAAAAEHAGHRPCAHCQPALAPLPAARNARESLARRAAARLIARPGESGALADLAAALGVAPRRLSSAFTATYAVTPEQFANTQQRLLALRLLANQALLVGDVALAGGFGDSRRLNTALAEHYPYAAQTRRASHAASASVVATFDLPYEAPYAWPRLLGFLAGRAIEGCEAVDAGSYRRTLRAQVDGREFTGWIEVSAREASQALEVRLSASLLPALPAVLARAWHAFDLGAHPAAIAQALGALAATEPGLRLPGTFDPFELTVRAILGQQITVSAARTLARRFAAAFGTPLDTRCTGLDRLFPNPATVASLTVDAIASLGIIGARARTIIAVAGALVSGEITLRPGDDLAQSVRQLKALPGIGEWTAQYIAMRALGATDAFPHTDYGVMKALNEKNPRRVLALAEPWRPFRAYAVMHLWRSLG